MTSVDYRIGSVALNNMVRRQTARSKYSHFDGSFDELETLIAGCLKADDSRVTVLSKDGLVLKLRLPEDVCDGRFYTSIVKLEAGMQVRSVVAVRERGLDGELPYVQTVVVGSKKTPSKWVDVIIYHKDVLKPGELGTVEADWHIISVNAHITEADEPATPQAMARNHSALLGLPEGVGGSAREYTDEDYRVSTLFWGSHAMVEGEE